jgi:hypothetical protein
MQTGGCDVSGEFMALRNEKQTGSAESYTPDSLDPGTALCLLGTLDPIPKSNYFLSFVFQVSTPLGSNVPLLAVFQ